MRWRGLGGRGAGGARADLGKGRLTLFGGFDRIQKLVKTYSNYLKINPKYCLPSRTKC